MTELPIEEALPRLQSALRSQSATVLQAPPGAGKTTRVPLALLEEPWLGNQKIVLLEPRRLAARAAAHRMASLLGEAVGDTVGYRIRMDSRVGPRTRVEVVTEGVLTRQLQSDPALEGVGLVIFDEFHERSLHADLGLALCLQSQELLRDDLRLLVMSATLDGGPVAELLGGVPIVTSEGRSFPVETRYGSRPERGRMEFQVVRTILDAMAKEHGDLLVFLPGAGEIRRVADRLAEMDLPPEVGIMPLYGNLPQEAQDRAIAPSPPGHRKIVLSTAIAETSLTIEGVRVVIDSGQMRVPRFDPRIGMTRLATIPVSRASADQRRGRAGRTEPGICYRLWAEHEQLGMVPQTPPEILDTDLAPLALELALWGVHEPGELKWLDVPPSGAFAQARELLRELGALDDHGTVTAHGRRMAELPLHPRLAHMVLHAESTGEGPLACDVAAILGERDLFRSSGAPLDADLRLRLEALRSGSHRGLVDKGTLRRVQAEARRLRRLLRLPESGGEIESAGRLLALAYPDRVAQRRSGQSGRFLLRNGRGAQLAESQSLAEASFLVAAQLDGQGRESRVYLAAPLTREDVEAEFGAQVERQAAIAWDREAQAVRAREQHRLGALLLKDAPLREPDPEAVADALQAGIAQEGLEMLPWNKAARQLQQRLVFLHRLSPDWPDVSDAALLDSLDLWLRPFLSGMRRREDLQRLDLSQILLTLLPWERQRELEEDAPSHCTVPSGSRVPIDYSDPEMPVLAVRLQEVFGLQDTPLIGWGRVPLTLHLLSPARRPVQVTRDLASFWRSGYFEVKKDLKGRYPKHYWPDDPLQATPTRRTRPRA